MLLCGTCKICNYQHFPVDSSVKRNTGLFEALFDVCTKFFHEGLEWCLEFQAFSWHCVHCDDNILYVVIADSIEICMA